jgi:hypothetical protein
LREASRAPSSTQNPARGRDAMAAAGFARPTSLRWNCGARVRIGVDQTRSYSSVRVILFSIIAVLLIRTRANSDFARCELREVVVREARKFSAERMLPPRSRSPNGTVPGRLRAPSFERSKPPPTPPPGPSDERADPGTPGADHRAAGPRRDPDVPTGPTVSSSPSVHAEPRNGRQGIWRSCRASRERSELPNPPLCSTR